MGRWNHGNRSPGDCDQQVSDVIAIGTWQQNKRNAVWVEYIEILSVTGQRFKVIFKSV